MEKLIQGWQCPLCKTVYSPLVSSCTCSKNNQNSNNTGQVNNIKCNKANWIIWGGWKGNHDRRIDDAKCSNCGFIHPTVYNSIDNLNRYCPLCNSEMTAVEEG